MTKAEHFRNTDNLKKRIVSVEVRREVDDSPDLSFIGEYSNSADSPAAIDRQERGDCGRGEYRYFNPAMTGEETGNPDSPEQDYARMEAYNRGDWCMMGVYAVAQVSLAGGILQTIRSGGIWGMESDSGDYFEELKAQELADLKDQLLACGFSTRQINAAFKGADFSD